jgi:hypothetical protein
MFTSREELLPIYERLIRHGMASYGPGDVMRFFGHRVKSDGSPWGNFPGEISSDVKTRAEGVRIKHRSNGNSLKMYDKLGQPVTSPGRSKPDGTRSAARRFRALQLFAEKDLRLLTAVSRPEFNQNGFRNRDLRPLLFDGEPRDDAARKRQSSAVSRQFALLRAHGLIRKVPHTHRYILTDQGRLVITALLAARNANALELVKLAA